MPRRVANNEPHAEHLAVRLPQKARVLFDSLYRNPKPEHLISGMFAVALPNNLVLDVGWEPMFDPNGRYELTIQNADADKPDFEFRTKSIDELKNKIEYAASELCKDMGITNGDRQAVATATSGRDVSFFRVGVGSDKRLLSASA